MGLSKLERRLRIKKRIRKTITGTTDIPRLSVFRSNKEIYAQIIDDTTGKTIVSASSLNNKDIATGSKSEKAAALGKILAESAKAAGVEKVKFDRNGFLYHGRVKSFADAARETGLNF